MVVVRARGRDGHGVGWQEDAVAAADAIATRARDAAAVGGLPGDVAAQLAEDVKAQADAVATRRADQAAAAAAASGEPAAAAASQRPGAQMGYWEHRRTRDGRMAALQRRADLAAHYQASVLQPPTLGSGSAMRPTVSEPPERGPPCTQLDAARRAQRLCQQPALTRPYPRAAAAAAAAAGRLSVRSGAVGGTHGTTSVTYVWLPKSWIG
eukprot:COSAG01_NODE_10165_length_2232_cov_11.557900_2_plen_210_part_00